MLLLVDGQVLQPMDKRHGSIESVTILPRQTGIVSRHGGLVTYTPLYRTALYEKHGVSSWYTFRMPETLPTEITVVMIGGNDRKKEKKVSADLFR